LVAFGCLVGKPASLYATTGFLASNFYAGQRPKPLYRFLHQGNTYIGSSDRDYSIGSQTENSQLLHLTGNSTLVLLIGKAAFASYAFFALHKQDSVSGSFKQQFALNLHTVSVVHFALIEAN